MLVISITFTTQQVALKIYFLDFYKDKNAKLHNFFVVPTIMETAMEALQENFCDGVSFSINTNLQCSDCNFAVKRTHHRFFSEYLPETSCLKKNKKRKSLFFLRKKSMMDQHLNKIAVLQYTIPNFLKKAELM